MHRSLLPLMFLVITACDGGAPAAEGEGEGEGEGQGEEGEGEGEEGEGEEGEGEGEGEEGEGEGEGGEGEGEGGTGDGQLNDPCDADDDCDPTLQCAFFDNSGLLSSHCAAPGVGAPVGSPCDDASDCDRGVCIQSNGVSMCSAPCDADSDCASTQECQTRSTTIPGVGSGVVDVCVANGDLPATPCDENADCVASGQVCNELQSSGANLELICGFEGAGAGQLGAACAGAIENDAQCATGLCDGDVAGNCTIACNSNDDCSGAAGFLCTGTGFTNVPGGFCADACAREADCAGTGRACRLSDNVLEDRVDLVCREDQGALAAGTSATTGADCQSGFLLFQTIDNVTQQFCTEFCVNDGDCPAGAGLTACVELEIDKPGGGPQTVTACARE